MAATSPSNPSPSKRTPTHEAVEPLTFDEKLNQFWQRNRAIVLGLCIVVLLAILGKGLWERMQAKHEGAIEAEYAQAATPDQLRAFAAAHPGHALAGIAQLRIADEAYAAGKASEAAAGYDKVLSVLKDGPLASRARVGRALANVQAGKTSEGESQLKQIANDASEFKAIRSEAAYQLASLAVDAHNTADAQKYIELLNQIDPSSAWARRAVQLQASLPRATGPAVGTAPIQLKSLGK